MARPKDTSLRARLLHAAALEFAEQGFAGASMSGIGDRAGVTKGGVYFHFRTKEDLFFAAVDDWRSGLRRALAKPPASPSAAAALRSFLATYLDHHFRQREASGLMRMLGTELRGRFTVQVRDDLRTVFRAVRARIRELLVEGGRDGSLFADDPATAAFVLAGAVEGIVQQWLASARDTAAFCHPETLADALVAPHTV